MIDALFNQPNYVAAKKMMDVTALRMEAASSNLANVETPNYRRVDVPESFEVKLREAIGTGQADRIRALRPELAEDAAAIVRRPDGNTVDLESEMIGMYNASIEHGVESRLVTGTFLKLKMAISGRPG